MKGNGTVRVLATALGGGLLVVATAAQRATPPAGEGARFIAVREPSWAPDGRRIAVSRLDEIWVMAPDGRNAVPLAADAEAARRVEREPAWSPDGHLVAFAGDTGAGFDLYVVRAAGGPAHRVTALPGDERWPSWTRDGRLVFAHEDGGEWDLYATEPIDLATLERGQAALPAPRRLTETLGEDERTPRVSPDGRWVVYASDRGSEAREPDLWALDLAATLEATREATGGGRGTPRPFRVVEGRGLEGWPAWSPGSDRLAYYAVRDGVGSVWVAEFVPPEATSAGESGREPDARPGAEPVRPRPAAGPVLVSRRGGVPAWSPDGRTILVATLPAPAPAYNGEPRRNVAEPPPLFDAASFGLWSVAAPRAPDEDARPAVPDGAPAVARRLLAFDRVWQTLRDLYYRQPPASVAWDRLRDRYRPLAAAAASEAALEDVVDALVAEQPLIKPAVSSDRAVVVSGHPLASQAGAEMLARGGNIVDAAIAVAFALGVVEPDASGIGGDGMAILYLKGMPEPVVVDYKDETPSHATVDNPAIFRDGRLVADGPAAPNIPGVVAGLDYLYTHYASGKLRWAELLAPAIRYAEEGFVLDEALPSSLREGRRYLEKYAAARRIFLPGGRVPQPGDRFVNADYGRTLRAIASGGGRAFYEGDLARRIVEDLQAHGGIMTREDLAQYRAIERRPLAGRYRGHWVYSAPPPVSTGAALIETLQILDHYRPRAGASYATDADFFHYVIEAWKVRDPIRRLADPGRWPVDLGDHLEPAHAAALFQRIDPERASRLRAQGGAEESGPPEPIGRGTTAFAVGDVEGNLIAVTHTLSTWGGNFYVSEGLGFLYNNHLRSSRTTAGYGQLLPLVRSSSTSVPTVVFEGMNPPGSAEAPAVPRFAVAAAGNAWIPASVYAIVTNVIDAGLGAQRAVEAPRFLVGRDPADGTGTTARIQIEDRFARRVRAELEARGHRFQPIGRKGEVRYGYAALVVVDRARGRVEGGAEPRRSHAAVAPEG
jgi:gamma-glutamyltranspeptidase/glutathione hydrolase